MNGFSVYKNISKPKNEPDYKAGYLYLKLLGNPNKTVDDILFLKTSTDEYKNEVYLQASILFDLREKIMKKLVDKEITRSNFNQSDIDDYEESIAERTKLRRQRLDEIKQKKKT